MKRLLLLTFVCFAVAASGQKSQSLSIEFGGNGYFSLSNNRPANFGGSVFVFDQINRFAFGFGYGIASNDFTENVSINGLSEPVIYDFTSTIHYFHLQFVFGIHENKNWNFNFTGGISFTKVNNQGYSAHLSNGSVYEDNLTLQSGSMFPYVNMGAQVVRHFGSHWGVVLRPTLMLTQEYDNGSSHYWSILYPVETAKVNIQLGVNYLIEKHTIPEKNKSKKSE
jgi:hypothetical protein